MKSQTIRAALLVSIGLSTGSACAASETKLPHASYGDCIRDAGFDDANALVQPLFNEQNELWWVKTSTDIPRVVHSKCFTAAGGVGVSGQFSSWGN